MGFSLEQGRKLVEYARKSILSQDAALDDFEDKKGVFVTIYTYPDRRLRGCIGFPYPVFSVKEAVNKAAKEAAHNDPRFPPLGRDESFIVEVSILTFPELLSNNIPEKIKIGKDGLIVECNGMKGLLLPIVFAEHRCSPETALEMTCEKAGLPIDSWKREDCKVYKFQAQVFAEEAPGGRVVQKMG